jgi:hypothetical protein
MEGVAFDPRLRQDDVIHDIRGRENHGSGTASRRKVSQVGTEGDIYARGGSLRAS